MWTLLIAIVITTAQGPRVNDVRAKVFTTEKECIEARNFINRDATNAMFAECFGRQGISL